MLPFSSLLSLAVADGRLARLARLYRFMYMFIFDSESEFRPESRIDGAALSENAEWQEWESPFRFRSTDEGRTTPRHAGRALRVYFITHVVSPLFQTQRESQTADTRFLSYTDGCALSPSGGRRTRH